MPHLLVNEVNGRKSEASEVSKGTLKKFVRLFGNFLQSGSIEFRSVFDHLSGIHLG